MKIILASGSPRRVELLKQFHMDFETVPSTFEEHHEKMDAPAVTVMGLAFSKALNVAQKYPDALIIASDTIVYANGILGKPVNRQEAESMLRALSGKDHAVYTGVALIRLSTDQKIVDYASTKVVFNALSEERIQRYLDTGEAFDKAGAYGIQGYGSVLVDHIEGDFFNVMGLPLSKLDFLLRAHFGFGLL